MIDLTETIGRHHSSPRARERAHTICRNDRLEDQETNMDPCVRNSRGLAALFPLYKACGSLPMPSNILPYRCFTDFIRSSLSTNYIGRFKCETAPRDRGVASPLSPDGGGQWQCAVVGGRNQPNGELQIHPHKSPIAPDPTSITFGETWRLFGVGNGSRVPAVGSSGETGTRMPADSRQPSLPGLPPVVTPEIKPTGGGEMTMRLRHKQRRNRELTRVRRRRVAGLLSIPLLLRWSRRSCSSLSSSTLADSVQPRPTFRRDFSPHDEVRSKYLKLSRWSSGEEDEVERGATLPISYVNKVFDNAISMISNPRLIPVAQLSSSLHRHTTILTQRFLTSPQSISIVIIAILLILSRGYANVRFEAHAS
ncbi:hypothetical protein LXL04_028553 [Taraxacum kok-saghyz]